MKSLEIRKDIHRLLDEQAEAIKGELGPAEASEYANRNCKIQELFSLLHNFSSITLVTLTESAGPGRTHGSNSSTPPCGTSVFSTIM